MASVDADNEHASWSKPTENDNIHEKTAITETGNIFMKFMENNKKDRVQKLEDKWRRSTEEEELEIVKEIHREIFQDNSSDIFNLRTTTEPTDPNGTWSKSRKTTVLHCLTKTIGKVPEEKEDCLRIFDDFISMSKQRAQEKLKNEDPNISEIEANYLEVRSLTNEIRNDSDLTVLGLAFQCGAAEVISRLMLMKNVYCHKLKRKKRYDISGMTPITSGLDICKCSADKTNVPCLELFRNNSKLTVKEILEIEPLKELEKFYKSITKRIYWIMAVIHVLYMVVFSYSSCDILHQRNLRSSPNKTSSSTTEIIFYVIVPLEPILLTVNILYNLFKVVSGNSGFKTKCKFENRSKHFCIDLLKLAVTVFYIVIICTAIYLYHANSTSQYYIISLSLLFGWLTTFFFTRGIQTLHFFLKVIFKIILRDVLKVVFVYFFFFLAFSFAIHVQFLSSLNIIESYKTPIHTMFLMFNVMVGMGDQLVNPDIESGLEDAGLVPLYSKILYTVYVVIVPIILLNLLIAMMNSSYIKISAQYSLIWQIDSILLGIDVERNVPGLVKLLMKGTIHHGKMFGDSSIESGLYDKEVWYIEVKTKTEDAQDCDDVDGIELDVLEQSEDNNFLNLTQRIQMMEETLSDIKTELKVISAKLSDINDNN